MDLHPGLWVLFGIFVSIALVVDLGLKSHRHRIVPMSFREAAIWSVVWVVLSLLFCLVIWQAMGAQRAMEFLTAYLIEKSLSVDNLFVFMLIFQFFAIPTHHQPVVLKWGILGAVGMRFVLIFTGVALMQRFHWILYVFGGILIITAIKMIWSDDKEMHPEDNVILKLMKRVLPFTTERHEDAFFVRQGTGWAATPLFATLVVVEASDLVFAIDSIPAVLAVSNDPMIVFTSNVFAILGLRALYFLVSGIMGLFRYLRYGLAVVLVFIGAKMLVIDVFKIPVVVSLGVVAFVLSISMLLSVVIKETAKHDA